jgi:hypothetical protein
LAALRARVHADPELVARLHGLTGAQFSGEVVRVAAELGCDVMRNDVDAAIAHGRQAWMLRWIR